METPLLLNTSAGKKPNLSARILASALLVLAGFIAAATPAKADETPVQLERVIHRPSDLPDLLKLNTPIFGGGFGGTLEFDASLTLRRFIKNGGFAPIDFSGGAYHVLGGDHSGVFFGHEPVTAVMTGRGNPSDASELSNLPALNLYTTPTIDNHELLTDAQGNYWYLTYPLAACDAYPGMCGANPPQSVHQFASCAVNQVSPTGQLLFVWNAIDHLPQSELRYDQWVGRKASTIYAPVKFGDEAAYADPFHCNSIDVDKSGRRILVSMRHTDAIYLFDKSSGDVQWKIGGNRWPGKSLAVADLPVSQRANPLSGQHDARLIGENSVSVFDNSTGLGRPARGIVFKVDRKTHSASAQQVMTSPFNESSNCTGSFRQMGGGRYWIAGWGCATASATVFDSSSRPIVSLRPTRSADTKAYFAAIWPGGLSDLLVQMLTYRFTPSDDK
jgi:hypothetical protein